MPERTSVGENILFKPSEFSVKGTTDGEGERGKLARTGPISRIGVNSRTFSMGAFLSSSGGGSNMVTLFDAIIARPNL
jgi:hypothetical protein